ncbi:hypothetical protein EYR41_010061 [Orbilia oligospora]|uniref:Uncharacterized protein n=1 Tax=Orbilia oligospora TaxID=2813651 RepID=A0A7C8KN97_ORBOL|nr:hypothetical protein TWF751_005390 [Orbilia oligospora]KAF3292291.1 hypothetical protein TWF132_005681 [Orbilia oligospora]TGJ63978.1 hypothetical protein EYR41_010061 [Orbilia oligospora]
MHIPRDHFSTAYNRLKRSASGTVPSILILTSLDVDSLCACRMLTRLLKTDYIPHKLHPVAGYQDLTKANKEFISNNDDLKFLILLGVGGLVDIAEFLELKAGVECWVLESRRPWNLQNIFAGPGGEGFAVVGRDGHVSDEGGVVCWDDGDIVDFLKPEQEAYRRLIEMQEEVGDIEDWNSEDEEDDEDEEFAENRRLNNGYGDGPEDTSSSTNSRKRRSSSEDEDEDDGEEEGYSDDDRRRRKRIHSGSSTPDSSPHAYSHLLHIHGPNATGTTGSSTTNANTTLTTAAGNTTSLTVPTTGPSPLTGPALRAQRKNFLQLRRKYNKLLTDYYSTGSTYGEPISSLVYSLASELGREDNDLLWLATIGWEAQQMYGRHMHSFSGDQTLNSLSARSLGVWGVLRDEVRRLNPPTITSGSGGITSNTSLFTRATTAEDYSLRLSPEFRFMLIRHWSLYDSMLHSPYLASKLHLWSEAGKKRLAKLLATMGMSLQQCNQKYVYMDMDLKKGLREKLEVYKARYGLDEIVREGVVRCWGWNGCLSAGDVAVIVGCLLEVGKSGKAKRGASGLSKSGKKGPGAASEEDLNAAAAKLEDEEVQESIANFQAAYDAIEDIESLKASLPLAMTLHRSILSAGTALIEKRQIKHLRAYRLAVVKEGPDVATFTNPSALTKLALWLAEAIREQELEKGVGKKKGLPLVVAALNEARGCYIIVGTGVGNVEGWNLEGRKVSMQMEKDKAKKKKKTEKENEKKKGKRSKKGKENNEDEDEEEEEEEEEEDPSDEDSEDSDSDSDDEDEHGRRKVLGRNRFGIAFQEVAGETSARVRIDSFEACVVEVKKDDLGGFLEGLSMKSIVG